MTCLNVYDYTFYFDWLNVYDYTLYFDWLNVYESIWDLNFDVRKHRDLLVFKNEYPLGTWSIVLYPWLHMGWEVFFLGGSFFLLF